MDRPHRGSSVTRTASIRRACASSRTRLRASRLSLAPDAVSLKMPTHLEAAALGEGGELGNPSASRNASAAGQTTVMACSSTPASPRSASTRTALPDARITARALMPDPRSHGGACLSPGARAPRGISRGVAIPRDPAGVCPAGLRPASLATHPHLPGPAPTCARAAQHPRHRPIEARPLVVDTHTPPPPERARSAGRQG